MAVQVQTLIDQIRDMTMTRNNLVVSDSEIAGYITDAAKVLFDIFIANGKYQHWFFSSFTFTLAGGVGGNFVDLPTDFQVDIGLNLNPTSATPTTVPSLATFNDRNDLAQWGGFAPNLPGMPTNRRYALTGDQLQVLPINSAAGDYELFYQAQFPDMLPLQTKTADVAAFDVILDEGGYMAFNLSNMLPLDPGMVNGTLTVNFDSPNDGFNGNYSVQQVLGNLLVTTSPFTAPLTNPAAGTASIAYQPAGTISALPQVLAPWQLFIKAHASITIGAKRDITNAEHVRMLDQEHARAVEMSQIRKSNLAQSPLTRGHQGAIWTYDDAPWG